MVDVHCGWRMRPALRCILGAVILVGSFPWQVMRADTTISNCVESALDSALARGGRITFTCGGTINVTSTKIIVTDTILDASAAGGTIGTTSGIRLFTVSPGASLTIIGLTLSNGAFAGVNGTNGSGGGWAFGGAIYNNGGSFLASSTTFLSNSVTGGAGGAGDSGLGGVAGSGGGGGFAYGAAIYNLAGLVQLTNCVFRGNNATGGAGGDGADAASISIAQEGGRGGNGGPAGGSAVYNSANGTVVAVNCTFSGNRATGAAGGVGGAGSGGLGFPGDNGAAGAGNSGGFFNDGGQAVVAFSSFLTNSAAGAAGRAGRPGNFSSPGFDGSPGAAGNGGGILNVAGTVMMTNCTLFANTVTGGVGGVGGTGGTTGFGGSGGNGGGGGAGLGGAVGSLGGGSVTLVNVTLLLNRATGGAGGAGGQRGASTANPGGSGSTGLSTGGSVAGSGSPVILKNSILAYTSPGLNAGGTISDDGHNLSSDATPAFTAPSSRNSTDPLLSDPANNGGPTQTAALAGNSPAIDAGDPVAGPDVDQRYFARSGQGDIGAYEFNAGPVAARMSIRRVGGDLVISWPSSFPDYELESSASLAPAAWTPVGTPPVLIGFDLIVTNALGSFDTFYRLIQ